MRHIIAEEPRGIIEYIVDNFGKVTAQKISDQWERTYNLTYDDTRSIENLFPPGKILKENEFYSEKSQKPKIAQIPIFEGDFSQVFEGVREYGLLRTVESLTIVPNALFARHLIEQEDIISALAIKKHFEMIIYGSHGITTSPEDYLKEFSDIIHNGLPQ